LGRKKKIIRAKARQKTSPRWGEKKNEEHSLTVRELCGRGGPIEEKKKNVVYKVARSGRREAHS